MPYCLICKTHLIYLDFFFVNIYQKDQDLKIFLGEFGPVAATLIFCEVRLNDRFFDRSTEEFRLDSFSLFGTKHFRDKVLPNETKFFLDAVFADIAVDFRSTKRSDPKKTTSNVYSSTVLEQSLGHSIGQKNSTPLLLSGTKYFSGRQLDFSLFCEWNGPFFQKVFVEFYLSFRFVVEYMQSKYRATK